MITRLDLSQDAGRFAQHGGLANTGFAQQQDALAGFHQVLDDINGAVNRAPDAAGESNDDPVPVADGGYAVQGALQAGAVIGVKFTDT